jgi:hypothetical protein
VHHRTQAAGPASYPTLERGTDVLDRFVDALKNADVEDGLTVDELAHRVDCASAAETFAGAA